MIDKGSQLDETIAEACGMEDVMQTRHTATSAPSEAPQLLFLAVLSASEGLTYSRRQAKLIRKTSSAVDAAVFGAGFATFLKQAPESHLQV